MPNSKTEPAPPLAKIVSSPYALVVEDDPDARVTLMMCLQEEGFKCVGANNGLEALLLLVDTSARNSLPALIFLDINMPVMTGWQLMSVLYMCGTLHHIPVYITTGESIPANDQYKVLRKPYSLDKVLEIAHRHLTIERSNGPTHQVGS